MKTAFCSRKALSLYLLLGSALTIIGCKQQEDIVFDDPNGDHNLQYSVVDTSSLNIKVLDHHGITGKNLENDLVGVINDPILGQSSTLTYMQLIPDNTTPDLGTNPVTDFLELTLRVDLSKGFLGDLNKPIKLTVYQLNETLSGSSEVDYKTDTNLLASTALTGQITAYYRPSDSSIKFRLNNDLGVQLLNSSIYQDERTFVESVRGLAIVADSATIPSGDGLMLAVDLVDERSKLEFHYTNNTGAKAFRMTFGAGTRITALHHKKRLGSYYANYNVTNPEVSYFPIFANGGNKLEIDVPHLKEFVKGGNIALFKAEVVLPVEDVAGYPFNQLRPVQLILRPKASTGRDSLNNFVDDLLGIYDGKYSSSDNSYHFVLTKYFQNILTMHAEGRDPKTYGMNLQIPPDDPSTPTRVNLASTKSTGAKPRLVLYIYKP